MSFRPTIPAHETALAVTTAALTAVEPEHVTTA